MCGCLYVRVCVYAFRIVSMDKILRFTNTLLLLVAGYVRPCVVLLQLELVFVQEWQFRFSVALRPKNY